MNKMDFKDMKKSRMGLDILQVAATDKENLTQKITSKKKIYMGNGRLRLGKKEKIVTEPDNKAIVDMKNNFNKVSSEVLQTNKIETVSESDLTGDAPSEKYWEKLAESRRVALESALKENVNLHNRISEMEYENSRLTEMLNEAQTLVKILSEMLEGTNDDDLTRDSAFNQEEAVCDAVDNEIAENEAQDESFVSCTSKLE